MRKHTFATGFLTSACTLLVIGISIVPISSTVAEDPRQVSRGETNPLEPFELLVAPVSKSNRRNSEATVINLSDGSLLLAYTRFRAGVHDLSPADIVTCVSSNGGKTWTKPHVVTKGDDATGNVLSASFLRLGSGAIALFYCKLTNVEGTGVFHDLKMRVSHDEGQTWDSERTLNILGNHSQVLLNDKAIRLSTGRILLPTYCGLSPFSPDPEFVQPLISDDDGETWFPSPYRVCRQVKTRGGLSESSVVERGDGSLLMISRTNSGFMYRSESQDCGETWKRPVATDIPASGSPSSLCRIPGSDDILLICNQITKEESRWGFSRHRLTAFISKDGGQTWIHRRNLSSMDERTYIPPEEGGPRGKLERYATEEQRAEKMKELGLQDNGVTMAEYSSLLFVGRMAVITYDIYGTGMIGHALQLRILPVEWFYENP